MFPLRAPALPPRSRHRLVKATGWPELPGVVFDRVVGVALDSRQRIYVAHRGERPLLRLHPDGTLDREIAPTLQRRSVAYDLRGPVPIPLGERYWLHGLHIDPWDNVWITDVSRHVVLKFSPDGELQMMLGEDGQTGADERRFYQPTHVCVLPSGEILVTDGYGNSRIVKFSPEGKFLFAWGRRGTANGEFHTPHVIVRGPDGRLYMTDRENDRIQVFHANGAHAATWSDLHSLDGLCVGPDGLLYASGGVDGSILRLDLQGRVLDAWSLPEVLRYPHGIAVTREGDILVAETGDRWSVSGRLPTERELVPRLGAEGSALSKLLLVS